MHYKHYLVLFILTILCPVVWAQNGEDTVFQSGGLSLQALNPEISITGDILGYYQNRDDIRAQSKFLFRGLGLHVESYLDPYSKFKAAVPFDAAGAELGEAYFTRFGFIKNVNLTIGKFRQQFGLINRWHKHGLDQYDFPAALRKVFGEGGLNQTGIALDWTMPRMATMLGELNLQITNGENGMMFSGNEESLPAILVHYKNYSDLSDSTYLELGLTCLTGYNDAWNIGTPAVTQYMHKAANVYGVDITLFWEPVQNMRYRNFVWRSEWFYVDKNILTPDNGLDDSLNPWGAYTYLQEKVSRTVEIGVRFDFYKPDVKTYAGSTGISPHAVTEDGTYLVQAGPYITWYQSPFVKFRTEYNYKEWNKIEPVENVLLFQCIFAAGPHKHEKY